MPKPRILPYIILGMLENQSIMSGKDMLNQFTNEISEFWNVSHSQLYPELRKMVEEELIEISEIDKKNKKEISYRQTVAGKETFKKWLEQPITSQHDTITTLKLYFINSMQSSITSELLQQELTIHQTKLTSLQTKFQSNFSTQEAIELHYGHYLILSRAIERETSYVNWLVKNIKKIDKTL